MAASRAKWLVMAASTGRCGRAAPALLKWRTLVTPGVSARSAGTSMVMCLHLLAEAMLGAVHHRVRGPQLRRRPSHRRQTASRRHSRRQKFGVDLSFLCHGRQMGRAQRLGVAQRPDGFRVPKIATKRCYFGADEKNIALSPSLIHSSMGFSMPN